MKTQDTSLVPPDVHAHDKSVLAHLTHGTPIDPETYQRVRQRAERITERLRQQCGEMSIAVDLVRGVRDEE